MTTALDTKIQQLSVDLSLVHDLVHGGVNKTVTTENGPVPSFAKYQADNLGYLIANAQAAATGSDTAKTAAVNAATAAETARDQSVQAKDTAVAQAQSAESSASSANSANQAAATHEQAVSDMTQTVTTKTAEAVAAAATATSKAAEAVTGGDTATAKAAEAVAAAGTAVSANADAQTAKTAATAAATQSELILGNMSSIQDVALSALEGAETARDKASNWSDAAPGVEVTPGRYSARHWAQQAAASISNGVIFRGPWSAASGIYPTPVDPAVPGDMYKVSASGVVTGTPNVDFAVGDSIIYDGAGGWVKIDSTDQVTSVAGRQGAVVLSKADVNLSAVDNTADADKPVSTAQAAAIAVVQTSLNNHKADFNNPHGLSKAQLNLANVEDKSSAMIRAELTSSNVTTALGFVPVNAANISNDSALGGNAPSATLLPTVAAVKAYADGLMNANDVLQFKGVIDASVNPNYPAAQAGHFYKFSVPGKIGGASGPAVEAGDSLYCIADNSAIGNHATVGANWQVIQSNIDGAVIGPVSAVSGRVAIFSGTTGKLLADSGLTLAGTNTGDETVSTIGTLITNAAAKAALDDSDAFAVTDSLAANVVKKSTWSQIKSRMFSALGVLMSVGTAKGAPSDTDLFVISDSTAGNSTKVLSWASIKNSLWSAVSVAGGTIEGVVIGAATAVAARLSTLTTTAQTSLAGAAGTEALRAIPLAGAVNRVEVTPGLANAPASVKAAGSDTNVDLVVAGQGLGAVRIANSIMASTREVITATPTVATGAVQFDALTQGILYYTANSAGNWTLNVRASSTQTLDGLMAVGQALTVVFMATNGGTAYFCSALSIDGTVRPVKWLDGSPVTSGNAAAVDAYTYTIIKTAANAFTVLAQRSKFA